MSRFDDQVILSGGGRSIANSIEDGRRDWVESQKALDPLYGQSDSHGRSILDGILGHGFGHGSVPVLAPIANLPSSSLVASLNALID